MITVFTNQSHATSGVSSFREQSNKSDATNIWRPHRDIFALANRLLLNTQAGLSLIHKFHIYFALRRRSHALSSDIPCNLDARPLRQLLRSLIQNEAEIVDDIFGLYLSVYERLYLNHDLKTFL